MYEILKKSFFFIGVTGFLAIGLVSCNNKAKEDEPEEKIDSTQSNFVKVDNAIFSIPSPYQTASLIKKLGVTYKKELCNQNTNTAQYSTNFKKGLNLGVYGADLGYVAIYEQSQDALNYLKASQKLASDLGIGNAFDGKTLERIQKALGSKDSLLSISALAFRAGNNYLQTNERNDVAGLIVAGGFIESLHLTVSLANQFKTQELFNRIGEQKNSLDNLIKLLTPYYEQPEYTEFIDQLIDLAYVFDAVETKYTFIPPSTDEQNKITVINGKSEVIITEEQLSQISQKVKNIRTQIVG
jgi:hypothetical protein